MTTKNTTDSPEVDFSALLAKNKHLRFSWHEIQLALSISCIEDENGENVADELIKSAEKRGAKFKE